MFALVEVVPDLDPEPVDLDRFASQHEVAVGFGVDRLHDAVGILAEVFIGVEFVADFPETFGEFRLDVLVAVDSAGDVRADRRQKLLVDSFVLQVLRNALQSVVVIAAQSEIHARNHQQSDEKLPED